MRFSAVRAYKALFLAVPLLAFVGISTAKADTITDAFDSQGAWSISIPSGSGISFNGAATFSYTYGEITRSILVAEPSTVTLGADVFNNNTNRIGSGEPIADSYTVGLADSQIQSSRVHGWERVSLSTTILDANQVVQVRLGGIDNGFWYGAYGPSFDNLTVDIQPLAPTTTTTVPAVAPSNAVWAVINEGWAEVLAAPQGSRFTEVLFASYGTPTGSNGIFEQGWCHANASQEIIENAVLNQQSVELHASNGVFGDPCGGTYKQLAVVLRYTPIETTTTTSSTTIPPTTTSSSTTTSTTIQETTTTWTSTTTTVLTQNAIVTTTQAPSTTAVATTTVAPTTTLPTQPEQSVSVAVASLAEKAPSDIEVNEVVEVLATDLSPTEIEAVVEVLKNVLEELDPAEQDALAEALSEASDEVKAALEEQVNVFSGKLDKYKPIGSKITVGERRVIIAAVATAFAIPAAAATSRRN